MSDGEYGKQSWSNYILKRISGFEIRPDQLRPVIWLGRDRERFAEAIFQDFPRLAAGTITEACVGPIRYLDHSAIDRALANFNSALRQVKVEEAFFTAVAPASTAYDGVNEYYPNEHDYVYAIADALREEYRAIYDAGCFSRWTMQSWPTCTIIWFSRVPKNIVSGPICALRR